MALEYRILGPLELRVGDRPLVLGGERQRKLLAVLLLNAGEVVSFDQLVYELWDDPPRTARRQVPNAVAGLRRVLGTAGGVLVTTARGYRLRTVGDPVDADAFRSLVRAAQDRVGHPREAAGLLREALALWRAPLLDGLSSPSISAARDAMAEQRLVAVERLACLRLELEWDDTGPLATELVGHLAEHPLRESLRATLMRTLSRAGRRGDALAVFEDGRRLLAERLGADPGLELRTLHDQLLRSDPVRQAPSAVGSFLPSDTPDFTGRAAELDRMLATIADRPTDRQVVLAIEGMGGVGKTALAVRLAHLLFDRYRHGRYFVDLRGYTEGQQPMPVDAALEALLSQSGLLPNQMPTDLDARRDRWRERTAGRRVLVVLDNASDSAQVRQLLPGGTGSLVLVTSRRQLVDLEGAVPLPLGVLAADTAAELFRRIAATERFDAEQEAGRAVLGLCGGLPLAVRIAASRFHRRPTWTMAHLADQLRSWRGRDRTLSVSGVIALSYHHLTPAGQRLFRLLGLVPGYDFDAHAVAALAELTVAEAGNALETLLEHNLLMQQSAGRYCLHDLVRDCANGLVDEDDEEPRQARHRLFDYYLSFVDVHCLPLAMGRPRFRPDVRYPAVVSRPATQEEALRRLGAEYRNLAAVAAYTSAHGWLGHAWQLPCLLLPYFVRVGLRSGASASAENALRAARELGDRRGVALALQTGAYTLREQGRILQAQDLVEESIAISSELGDLPVLAFGQRGMGFSLARMGRLTEAARCFTAACETARAVGDQELEAWSTISLAVVDGGLGHHDRARKLLEQARLRHRRAGSVDGEIISLVNIAWLDHLHDRDDRTLGILDRAVRLSRTIGFVPGEVFALSSLAVAYRVLGRLDRAIVVGRTARHVARRSELPQPKCHAITSLAEAYLAAGRRDKARATLHEAEHIALAGNLREASGRVWEGLAHLAADAADHAHARDLWKRALANYPSTDMLNIARCRTHLAAVGDPTVRCGRCRSEPVAHNV